MTFHRTDQGERTTLRIEGMLDAVSTAELRPVIETIVSEQRRHVTVDLASLRLIDSSGVGALVSLYKRVREAGGEVLVVGARGQPLQIFRLLNLHRIFST